MRVPSLPLLILLLLPLAAGGLAVPGQADDVPAVDRYAETSITVEGMT